MSRRGHGDYTPLQQHASAIDDDPDLADDDYDALPAAVRERLKRKEAMRRVTALLHTFGWILAAAFIIYHTDIYRVIYSRDPRIDRLFFSISVACVLGVAVVVCYVTLYAPYVLGIRTDDYYEVFPEWIQAATGFFVVSFFGFMVSLWPIWGWVTIPIVIVLYMAFILGLGLLPSCPCCP